MIPNNHSYEEQTRRLITEAQSELVAVEKQLTELQEKQSRLVKEIEGYESALRGYLARTGRQEATAVDWRKLLATTKTLKDRLIRIAKHNGGKITQSQATDILYSNKLTGAKTRSTAYVIVQMYLSDMAKRGIFEKIAPGEYKLIGAQQILPDVNR